MRARRSAFFNACLLEHLEPRRLFSSTLSQGLEFHLTFDETSGSVAADASGNGRSGALAAADPDAAWTGGRIGGGLFLNQSDTVTVTGYRGVAGA